MSSWLACVLLLFKPRLLVSDGPGLIRNISPVLLNLPELCWETQSHGVRNYSMFIIQKSSWSSIWCLGSLDVSLISVVRKPVFTDGTCDTWDSCLDQKQAILSLCLAVERALMDGWCVWMSVSIYWVWGTQTLCCWDGTQTATFWPSISYTQFHLVS